MKSKLLFITILSSSLSGMIYAQGFDRRAPDSPGYGRERPRVVTNTVTPEQLTQWMQSSIRSNVATADQWCYAMGQLVPGGYTCPGPDKFGFAGDRRNSRVDAQTFLNNLRTYETGASNAPYANAPYTGGEGREGREGSPGVLACRRGVEDRLRDEGYYDVHIPSITPEDRPGGEDRVHGLADARGQDGRRQFDFSCGVNLERGDLGSLDVNPR